MSKKAETVFKERVAKDLKTLPNTWFVKIQQLAIRGIPDFLMCINGYFIAIELKRDGKAIRAPLQEWTLDAIAACGGMSYLAYPGNWEPTFQSLTDLALDAKEHVFTHKVSN